MKRAHPIRDRAGAARIFSCVAAAWILVICAGCAPATRMFPPGAEWISPGEAKPENGWWYASFYIAWPQGEEPSFYLDLLLAHSVVAPSLARHRNEIPLWRFHRRAGRDQSGHRFSFIVYCPGKTARKVFSEMESSAVLEELKASGLVLRVGFDDTRKIIKAGVEGTSDPNWSRPMQMSWPYFVMGASETWLDLIDRFAGDGRMKPFTLDEMVVCYRDIDEAVRQAWSQEGAHAFLHHLNALFGYGPVTVKGKYPLRF